MSSRGEGFRDSFSKKISKYISDFDHETKLQEKSKSNPFIFIAHREDLQEEALNITGITGVRKSAPKWDGN